MTSCIDMCQPDSCIFEINYFTSLIINVFQQIPESYIHHQIKNLRSHLQHLLKNLKIDAIPLDLIHA